jgi:membrane protease YdiL (CAAX protease family)
MASPTDTGTSSRQFVRFVGLLAILTAPFYALGATVDTRLPTNLPVSSLMFICPMVATLVLTHRASGSASVRALLRRTVDPTDLRRNLRYLPAVLVVPAVMAVSYWLIRLAGRQLPLRPSPLSAIVVGFVAFLIGAAAEETAWTGYSLDPLQSRWGAVTASLLIGVVWAAWHVMPWLQVHSVTWTAGQFLFTIASRVLIVWLYNKAGSSVLFAVLFHAVSNLAYGLFPGGATHYDPVVAGPLLAVVALAAVPSLARQNVRSRTCSA